MPHRLNANVLIQSEAEIGVGIGLLIDGIRRGQAARREKSLAKRGHQIMFES